MTPLGKALHYALQKRGKLKYGNLYLKNNDPVFTLNDIKECVEEALKGIE